MSWLSFTVQLARDPECPICRERLLPDSVKFSGGIAYCRNCIETTPTEIVVISMKRALDPQLRQHWSASHGLQFFTPKSTFPPRTAAHLLDETHDHPHVTDETSSP